MYVYTYIYLSMYVDRYVPTKVSKFQCTVLLEHLWIIKSWEKWFSARQCRSTGKPLEIDVLLAYISMQKD